MDEIIIENLQVFAYHGVHENEKQNGQIFLVSAVLYQDLPLAGKTDELQKTTNYGAVARFIEEYTRTKRFDLIESLAESLATEILVRFSLVNKISIEIKKPEAPVELTFDYFSVKITRAWHRVYLSVGSNMGDKRAYIEDAIRLLGEDEKIKDVLTSKLIVTKPYGGVVQDDFLNGAVSLLTLYTPEELLARLHEIEANGHRERTLRWGPRTIDLDILLYDDLVMNSSDLTIPHIDMHNREFVLKPLAEIAPFAVHPVYNASIVQLLNKLSEK